MTDPAARALAHVRGLGAAGAPPGNARITVNFHPDRRLRDGRTVAEHLAADGVYRSQFETGISNGGLTARPGGDRERWEHRMFAGRALDDYVEAQIHGGVTLTADVEAVVADPSFSGTPTAEHLARLGPLSFHPGFELTPAEFPDHLRGPEAPALACSLGVDVIDAAVVGRADTDPQLIKYLWHILVLLGRPHTRQE
jgi:hypothetical protein